MKELKRNLKAHFSTSLGRSPVVSSHQPLELWHEIPKRVQGRRFRFRSHTHMSDS